MKYKTLNIDRGLHREVKEKADRVGLTLAGRKISPRWACQNSRGVEMDIKALEKRDKLYHDYNQTENLTSKILEERGHPNAEEYRALRNFFDQLRHFANSEARFYSFEDDGENTEYWASELHIRATIHPCDGGRWDTFIREINIEDFRPYLNAGSWIISTRNEEFFNAIEKLEGVESIHVSYKGVPAGHKRAWEMQMRSYHPQDHFTARVFLDNLKQFEAVKAVVDKFVKPLEPYCNLRHFSPL